MVRKVTMVVVLFTAFILLKGQDNIGKEERDKIRMELIERLIQSTDKKERESLKTELIKTAQQIKDENERKVALDEVIRAIKEVSDRENSWEIESTRNATIESEFEKLLKQLKSTSSVKERKSAGYAIINERKALIEKLIEIIKEESKNNDGWYPFPDSINIKNLAIMLLGEMRAPEAIDVLVFNVDRRHKQEMNATTNVGWIDTPAAIALKKIGSPAIPSLMSRLSTIGMDEIKWADPKRTLNIMLSVLRGICGDEVAKFILKRELDAQADKDKKANLQKAIEILENPLKKDEQQVEQK